LLNCARLSVPAAYAILMAYVCLLEEDNGLSRE